MSSVQVGVILRHIRQLSAVHKDDDVPDRQLLERFAASHDEAAFAVLLKRHGPMVLGVCRSVLHDWHDAEDAFQAAFLILARKAGSIHRREAVSAWLYRVAYHLAVKSQASAARRRVHERRAVPMPPADPVLDMSLRELRNVLNEELQRLPEQFRAPLVLCCLEEKSLEEAARLLGWTKGAVKGRLQRGREQLRQRLRRRGLELSAGLLTAALSTGSASAQVPAALTAGTLRAALHIAAGEQLAVGAISARVAALVQGANAIMFTSKAKVATIVLLALSIGVTGLAAVLAAHPQEDAKPAKTAKPEARSAPPETAKPESQETIAIRGQVLDPDGKPFAGAKVYFAQTTHEGRPLSQQATSGADGRFRFSILKAEAESDDVDQVRNPSHLLNERHGEQAYWPAAVMAVAPGHGCDWAEVGSGTKELTLRLVKDVSIRGRILDPDGKPVVGAKLTLTGVAGGKGDLGNYLDAVRKGREYKFAKGWAGPLGGQPTVLIAGADGRFELTGVGGERVVSFLLEGLGIATASLEVMTRAAETVAGSQGRRVYGASFDYVAVATRPIRGVVRDKDTGKPMAGVCVSAWTNPRCKAVTGKEGRYELLGLAKSGNYWLLVKPTDGLYFQRQVGFEDTPGLGALTGDIEMVRWLTVRGKVTDKATGKPVAQAQVDYQPLFRNPHVNVKLAGQWVPRARTITGPDGSYALTVLPGPGVIGVTGPRFDAYMQAWVTLKERKDFFKGAVPDPVHESILNVDGGGSLRGAISQEDFHALVLLDPGEKEELLVKDVALEPAHIVSGRVVGPDNQPLTGVTVFGLVKRFGKETLKGADFTVRMNPRVTKRLVFYHKDKNLGFFLKELRPDTTGPLTVKLQPCGSVSGRVVDQDGQPVAGGRIQVLGMGLNSLAEAQVVTTDKEGRFRAEGLVPGQEYGALWSQQAQLHFHTVVESGEHKDLRDIKIRLNK
jgi:RNA polymerase sigma factor (sigma-70 family)